MEDKKYVSYIIQLSIVLVVALLLVAGGTFAYWQWASTDSKNVVFNTVSGFEEYVVYDPGESHFVGNFEKTSSFCESPSITVSAYKTRDDIDFTMTINMDINSIGSSISNSNNIYWVVTRGNKNISCSTGINGLNDSSVVSYGTFNSKTAPSSFALTESIKITSSVKEYTVWIWIADDTGLTTGETVNTNIWSQIDMLDKKENKVGEAYAVYSTDDNSLRFYRSTTPIEEGSQYRGRTATNVYTGFENSTNVPWWEIGTDLYIGDLYETTIVFEDYIYPVSTANWFRYFRGVSSIDVTKLDTSNVTDMSEMFRFFSGDIVGWENWDTSNVTDMSRMFEFSYVYGNIINLENWDTSNVTDMSYIFYVAGGNITGIENWDTSSVTNMSYMFYETRVNITGIENWDTSNVTDMSGMFEEVYPSSVLNLSGWKVCKISTRPSNFSTSSNIIEPYFGNSAKCNGGNPNPDIET